MVGSVDTCPQVSMFSKLPALSYNKLRISPNPEVVLGEFGEPKGDDGRGALLG